MLNRARSAGDAGIEQGCIASPILFTFDRDPSLPCSRRAASCAKSAASGRLQNKRETQTNPLVVAQTIRMVSTQVSLFFAFVALNLVREAERWTRRQILSAVVLSFLPEALSIS